MTSARAFGLVVEGMSGGEEMVLCPFHNDTHASAWFNPRKELFFCAVCSIGLNAVQLCQRLGIEREVELEEREPEDYNLIDDTPVLDLGKPIYHEYFKQRGVMIPTAAHYGLRWKYNEPQAAVLPLTGLKGETLGAVYRYLEPDRAGTRYKKMGFTTPVWPMHHLKGLESMETLIVTEGAWSAMRLHSYFYTMGWKTTIVSLLGAKANQVIVDLLEPFDVFYLYDGDEAGKKACMKMRNLSPMSHAYTLSISPDDMTDEQLTEMLEKLWETAK